MAKRNDINDSMWRLIATLPAHKDLLPHIELGMISQAQNGNHIAHTALVENRMRDVVGLALGVYLAEDWDCRISAEDVIAEGWKALSESVLTYSVNSQKSFWDYAKCWIFKGFRKARGLHNVIQPSEWQARMATKAREAYETLLQRQETLPTDEEVAVEMGLQPTAKNCRKVADWLLPNGGVAVESLQAEVADEDGNTTTLEAEVADEDSDWLSKLQRAEEVQRVRWMIEHELDEVQRTVLLDTLMGVKQDAIGAKFGKSRGWVDKVLRQTREYLKSRLGML